MKNVKKRQKPHFWPATKKGPKTGGFPGGPKKGLFWAIFTKRLIFDRNRKTKVKSFAKFSQKSVFSRFPIFFSKYIPIPSPSVRRNRQKHETMVDSNRVFQVLPKSRKQPKMTIFDHFLDFQKITIASIFFISSNRLKNFDLLKINKLNEKF